MCGLGSGVVRGGTPPLTLGKKKAWADEAIMATESAPKHARNAHLPMKDVFPIGGLLSFPGRSTVRRQIRRFGHPVKLPILA
jgi:hypothetical protein